jgi:HlyD family secretion protein
MQTWKKIVIAAAAVLLLAGLVGFTIVQSRRNVVLVQTDRVRRQELTSIVSASGEIKPKTYVNIGANAFGKITKLFVKEGDRVKAGAMLAQIENIQPAADVAATRAALAAARTDAQAAEAALKTSNANLARAKSDAERARLDYLRAEGLYKEALIAQQEYDAKKAAWESAAAMVDQAQAQVVQTRAQLESASRRIAQNEATLARAADVLSKTEYRAPFAGTVTNLPVREGETVVIGIQNAPGSTLMTLADMSVITAEVMVDETDIINVKRGQPAEVTIDAVPKKTFKAIVTDIGENALLRSTGVASSQSTAGSQEAKDFKVVVTLQDPPENLRPGLSCTARITTATRQSTVVVPIQALTMRERKDLQPQPEGGKNTVQAAAPGDSSKEKEQLLGVFVVRNRKAEFVPVVTGIAGTTHIEITSGVAPDEEIVTGSYKALRTLRNGASVKVDNSASRKDKEEDKT